MRCAPTSTPTGSDDRLSESPIRRGDMTTEGIEAVFLTTHNWGKASE
jgi:hypothetical protein